MNKKDMIKKCGTFFILHSLSSLEVTTFCKLVAEVEVSFGHSTTIPGGWVVGGWVRKKRN